MSRPKQKTTLMRLIFSLFSCIFLSLGIASGQTFSGTVTDSRTHEPLAYVNIGVVGKGIGTVSDINGKFSIPLHDSVNAQSLRFSCIGYKSRSYAISDFRKGFRNGNTVEMEQSAVSLKQVVVKPKVFRTRVLGNTNSSKSMIAGFKSNDLGSELGTIMKIKKAPTFIEDVNFNIAMNHIGTAKFRVNIYTMKNGQPDSTLLPEPVYVSTSIPSGRLTVDLKKYHLVTDTDFMVSLEWIEDYGQDKLYFSIGLMENNSMWRKTSQDKWQKASPIGIGFNSTVTYEK